MIKYHVVATAPVEGNGELIDFVAECATDIRTEEDLSLLRDSIANRVNVPVREVVIESWTKLEDAKKVSGWKDFLLFVCVILPLSSLAGIVAAMLANSLGTHLGPVVVGWVVATISAKALMKDFS